MASEPKIPVNRREPKTFLGRVPPGAERPCRSSMPRFRHCIRERGTGGGGGAKICETKPDLPISARKTGFRPKREPRFAKQTQLAGTTCAACAHHFSIPPLHPFRGQDARGTRRRDAFDTGQAWPCGGRARYERKAHWHQTKPILARFGLEMGQEAKKEPIRGRLLCETKPIRRGRNEG